MDCPQCRSSLVEISTLQLPQIDVCAQAHGLWLDTNEASLFIDDAVAFRAAVEHEQASGSHAERQCPRCSAPLQSRRVIDEVLLTCPGCQGGWFPNGALTRLHEHFRGGRVSGRLDESSFYRRAAARVETGRRPTAREGHPVQIVDLLYWLLVLGIGFLLITVLMGGRPAPSFPQGPAEPASR